MVQLRLNVLEVRVVIRSLALARSKIPFLRFPKDNKIAESF